MSYYFTILILAAHAIVTYGRSDGTIPASACESMVPGHSTNSPQTTESPYSVEAVSAYFVQNIYLRGKILLQEIILKISILPRATELAMATWIMFNDDSIWLNQK